MNANNIRSITQAASMIVNSFQKQDYDTVNDVANYIKQHEEITGDGDEFHNAGTDVARIGAVDIAFIILQQGLKRFERNTDILADLLNFGTKCKRVEELWNYYIALTKIEKRFWTWRAFVFSIDYLMIYLQYTDSKKEESCEKEILLLIDEYKKYFPNDERAYVSESQYYLQMHNEMMQEEALVNGMDNVKVCPQCALNYADLLFSKGEYEKAIPIAKKAVDIREEQPSINLGYAYYILAMSQEAIVRRTNYLQDRDKVSTVYNFYFDALLYLEGESGREVMVNQIRTRVMALERESGFQSGIKFKTDNDKDFLEKLVKMLESEQK